MAIKSTRLLRENLHFGVVPELAGGSWNLTGPVVLTKTEPRAVTKKNALAYRAAGRADKSPILTDLVDLVELRSGIATMRERRQGRR